MFLFHMINVIFVTSIVSFVLFFLSVEPLHLYVKETVAPVTTQSTTPSVPDTTVVLEGNSQKNITIIYSGRYLYEKIILLSANYLFKH